MNRLLALSVVAGLAVSSALAAEVTTSRAVNQIGKPSVVSTQTTTAKVKIVGVDKSKRTVKIQKPDGEVDVYKVGPEVRNFGQIKKGDVLTAREVERLAIYTRKGKDKPAIKENYSFSRAPKGAKPGFVAVEKIALTGKVQVVKAAEHKVVVTGPGGKSRTFDVAPDVTNLKQLKAGDVVVVNYTDTISIAVAAPKA